MIYKNLNIIGTSHIAKQSIDEVKEQGTIIVFPSFVNHQVREVRSGKRVSLVIWNLGTPWK